jgi:hypothetical protein
MKHLKYKLALAKAAHAALKSPAPMPRFETYTRAQRFFDLGGSLHDDMFCSHLDTIKAHDAVLAYRKEKAALANAVMEVQRELYEASLPSDLE